MNWALGFCTAGKDDSLIFLNYHINKQQPKLGIKSTVLPSQEGKQTTLGEPGVVIPKNPQEISAFKEVREVDAKKLNEEFKKEQAAKEAEKTSN